MWMPDGVRLRLGGTHDEDAPLGATVYVPTVAEGAQAIKFLTAMGVSVVDAEVMEVERRKVPLEGWRLDGREEI